MLQERKAEPEDNVPLDILVQALTSRPPNIGGSFGWDVSGMLEEAFVALFFLHLVYLAGV